MLAPTRMCTAMKVSGTGYYDGIYNRQESQINDFDWWQARNDVGAWKQHNGCFSVDSPIWQCILSDF